MFSQPTCSSAPEKVEAEFDTSADVGPIVRHEKHEKEKFLCRFEALRPLSGTKSTPVNLSSVSPMQCPSSILKEDLNANSAHRDPPDFQNGPWVRSLGEQSCHLPAPETVEAESPKEAMRAKSLQHDFPNTRTVRNKMRCHARGSELNGPMNAHGGHAPETIYLPDPNEEQPLDLTLSTIARSNRDPFEPHVRDFQRKNDQGLELLLQMNRVQGLTRERVEETMNELESRHQGKKKVLSGMLEAAYIQKKARLKRTRATRSPRVNPVASAPAAKRPRAPRKNRKCAKLDLEPQHDAKEVCESMNQASTIPDTSSLISFETKVPSFEHYVNNISYVPEEESKEAFFEQEDKAEALISSPSKNIQVDSSSKELEESKISIKQERMKVSRKAGTPLKRQVKILPSEKDEGLLSEENLTTASSETENVVATSSEVSALLAKMPDPEVPPLKQAKASKPKRDVTVGSNEQNQKKGSKRSRSVPRKASNALKGKKQKLEIRKTSLRSHGAKKEPVNDDDYCYCNPTEKYYGGWIGCDNWKCPVDWFHYHCAGFKRQSEIPAGLWYCHICRQDRVGKMKHPFVFQIAVDKFKATKYYPIKGDPDLDNIIA